MQPPIIEIPTWFWIGSTAVLFLLIGLAIGIKIIEQRESYWQSSKRMQRSVLGGKFSEQIATLLPHFPADLRVSEGRFLGGPVDFVFFKGMDENEVTEIVFLEVKTGKAQLTQREQQIREAIEQKRVRWHEYRVPEEITASVREN